MEEQLITEQSSILVLDVCQRLKYCLELVNILLSFTIHEWLTSAFRQALLRAELQFNSSSVFFTLRMYSAIECERFMFFNPLRSYIRSDLIREPVYLFSFSG